MPRATSSNQSLDTLFYFSPGVHRYCFARFFRFPNWIPKATVFIFLSALSMISFSAKNIQETVAPCPAADTVNSKQGSGFQYLCLFRVIHTHSHTLANKYVATENLFRCGMGSTLISLDIL